MYFNASGKVNPTYGGLGIGRLRLVSSVLYAKYEIANLCHTVAHSHRFLRSSVYSECVQSVREETVKSALISLLM